MKGTMARQVENLDRSEHSTTHLDVDREHGPAAGVAVHAAQYAIAVLALGATVRALALKGGARRGGFARGAFVAGRVCRGS